MYQEGWDDDEIRSVLFYIGGEIEVIPPAVKERLGR
jgi:hypothetical protein